VYLYKQYIIMMLYNFIYILIISFDNEMKLSIIKIMN